MRLDFSNFWQIQTLGYALLVGVLLCLSYDLIRFFNKLTKPNTLVVALVDIVYWIYAAVVTFCFFMLFSKGVIRLYAYFGFFIGFLVCRITISKLFMLALGGIINILKIISFWVRKPIVLVGTFLQNSGVKIGKKIIGLNFCQKLLKKFKKSNKKL